VVVSHAMLRETLCLTVHQVAVEVGTKVEMNDDSKRKFKSGWTYFQVEKLGQLRFERIQLDPEAVSNCYHANKANSANWLASSLVI
jgi:hypothetical protein